jgi:hypothetical protein
MPSFLTESGDPQARRLVLRPIQTNALPDAVHPPVAEDRTGERVSDQEWEFADPWGVEEESSARAVTRREGDVVVVVGIWVSDGAPTGTTRALVQQLVAVLRRTDASMVCSSVEESTVREELLAAGFVRLPGEHGADRPEIILQL